MTSEGSSTNTFKHSDIWYYYLGIIVLGMFPNMIISSPWSINLGGMNFGVGDLFTICILFACCYTVIYGRAENLLFREIIYCGLLLLIVFSFFHGFTKYSYRAIGELRYHVHVFTIGVAFYLTILYKLNVQQIYAITERTLELLAWIAVLCFFIIPMFSVEDFDFRGIKVLGTHQSFYLGAFILWLVAKPICQKKISVKEWGKTIVLFSILVLSKNRTALIAIIFSIVVSLFLKFRLKLLIYFIGGALVGFAVLEVIDSNIISSLSETYENVTNPVEDPNARWRILVQSDAIEQAMPTFWFGQGLGGYFYFDIPGYFVAEDYPHSQYILLFLKCGILSAICALSSIVSYIILYSVKVSKNTDIRSSPEQLALAMIIFSQILYGITYVFIPVFGLLFGFGVITRKKIEVGL